MAKPIIASDINQVADILSGIGTLVAPHDIAGFVNALCACINADTLLLQKQGAVARDYVCRTCTWHMHVAKIIAATQSAESTRDTP
jgi:hypothetical protein